MKLSRDLDFFSCLIGLRPHALCVLDTYLPLVK